MASPQLQVEVEVEVHAKLWLCFVCCFALRIDECSATRREGGEVAAGKTVATTDSAKDEHCLQLKRRDRGKGACRQRALSAFKC